MISEKHKTIFVHIPKTGGTSISCPVYGGVLLPYLGNDDTVKGGHKSAIALEKRFPDCFNDYYKFCFVRNPFDRLVSIYFYFLDEVEDRKSSSKVDTPLGKMVSQFDNFSDFAMGLRKEDLKEVHLSSQLNRMSKRSIFGKKILMDFVGRFEDIAEDFQKVREHLGIPHIELPKLRSTRRGPYREYYNEDSKEHIARLYKEDIEVFNYQF